MQVIPFQPEHLTQLRWQEHQLRTISHLTLEYAEVLQSGPSVSVEIDGCIVACGGIVPQLFGIGTAWACFDHRAGRHFVLLARVMRRVLQSPGFRRIEAATEVEFPPGWRMLEMLGFDREGVMRSYGAEGADHYRYAKING